MDQIYLMVLYVLASIGLAYTFTLADVTSKLRGRIQTYHDNTTTNLSKYIFDLFTCIKCLSFWTSIVFYFLYFHDFEWIHISLPFIVVGITHLLTELIKK